MTHPAAALDDGAPAEAGQPGPAQRGYLPGDISIWVFVLGDIVIFSVYFIIFMIYRTQQRGVFLESQRHLDLNLAFVNTLILLASSRFMALGVQAARASDHRRAIRLTVSGGACGLAFIAIKIFEWHAEISNGHTLTSNNFFMFYFMLTGIHVFHVVLGLFFVAIVVIELRNPKLQRVAVVETGATFWHMVDLLWIVIFALVYVMR